MIPTALKLAMSANQCLPTIKNKDSSGNLSFISASFEVTSSFTNLDRWSATTFSEPFLSLMTKSKS